ncbi:MD-2-related lipid-recognition protein-like [Chrysoperla carnea]|uniref:MD-2-related lipid-recognition protein-like n=1 Tax=Chrysoperla carnea TaxID=189513 RepID=UPI001D080D59|nr:MD-2-related lipid-recognition protein-like [Chrysoperla carnea]
MALYNQLFGLFIITICGFCYLISAEEVPYQICPTKLNVTYACDIKSVRIDPCKEALLKNKKPCKIKKGTHAGIAVDFIPKFSSDKLVNKAFWDTGFIDMEFLGMEPNACEFTKCPIVSGQEVNYNYQLEISKSWPTNTYPIKWRLMAEGGVECCFIIKIKLF